MSSKRKTNSNSDTGKVVRRSGGLERKTLMRLSSPILTFFLFLNLFCGFFLYGALASEKRPHKPHGKSLSVKKPTSPPTTLMEESFLELVKGYIGTPYRWGGASKKGMDCSGFVRHVYSKTFFLDLPHSSYQQYSLPIMKKIPKEDLRTGDLVFFSQKGRRVNHVGIYLEDGKFIHAARQKGVSISSLDNRYWRLKMVCAKRPAGVWKDEGADHAHSLSEVEIAMNDLGELSYGYAGNGKGYLSLSDGLRPSSLWQTFSPGGLTEGLTHTLGFQISRSFGDASWSMRLLQESRLRYSSEETDDFLTARPTYSLSERHRTLDTHLQGLKMAGDIHPFEWLQVTPSFSYVGYENGLEDSPSWGPGLGLEVRIRPLPARWSFSADVQYWEESDRLGGGFDAIDSWKSRNVSLMFGYDLSHNLKLSIVGQHGIGSFFSGKESDSNHGQRHNGLFLGLDWAF